MRRPRLPTHTGYDLMLLSVVLGLLAIGLAMVYSASGIKALDALDDPRYFLVQQSAWVAIGLAAMVVAARTDYHRYRGLALPALAASVVLLAVVLVPGIGTRVGGASRWLRVSSFAGLQPAELAKLALVLYLAFWLAARRERIGRWSVTVPFVATLALVVALVVAEPDLGTAIIVAAIGLAMYFVAGARLAEFAALGGLTTICVAAVAVVQPYRLARLAAFLDPWSDPKGAGFQTIQSIYGLALGGPLGEGLGAGKEKFGFLPAPYTDSIFAVLGDELGLLGTLTVVLLFLVIAFKGIRIALSAPDATGALLATGITVWLVFQAWVNMAVVAALVPNTGITLPFISYGGSSICVGLVAVGILLNVGRQAVGGGGDRAPGARAGRGGGGRPGGGRAPPPRRCKVLLVGGGTAGHVSPLLAVAEALAALSTAEVRFIGGRRGLEGDLARKAGIRFHATPLPSLRDPDSRVAFAWHVLLLPIATLDAIVQLIRSRPNVALTSGSFSSLPVLFAARLFRVPIYLWVGDAIPGRALRAVAGWSSGIGLTFEPAMRAMPRGRAIVTGNPVRGSLLKWTKAEGRRALGLPESGPVLFVTGGSQGSEKINGATFAGLARLVRRAAVVHHTGPAQLARAEAQRALLPEADRARYHPHGYLHEEMGAALAAADLVVGRAGSSSIAEPLAFGVPLVLIPFGASMSAHQAANARAAADLGAALILPESDLDGDRLVSTVTGLLDDPARLARLAANAKSAGRPAAAEAIARAVLALGGCA